VLGVEDQVQVPKNVRASRFRRNTKLNFVTQNTKMSVVLKRVRPAEVKALSLSPIDDATLAQADVIMKDVQAGGEEALVRIATKFGDLKPGQDYLIGREEMEKVYNSLAADEQALLQRVAARIRAFATVQRASISDVSTKVPGGTAGHTVSPCRTAGCYAPGGRYPLPSSVLMTAVTARVAGVAQVIVASPRPVPITIGAAFVAGADFLLCIGGAQAIAALAHGIGRVPACDVIVGPGNRWVTAAKSLVAGKCAIDMLAGPSECLVLADETADAKLIAADLLAQAEHDTDALPILVTTSEALIPKVEEELTRQLAALPTKETAAVSTSKGFVVLCDAASGGMEEAIRVCDLIAPEHLEVQVKDADAVWKKISNYGGMFIGAGSAGESILQGNQGRCGLFRRCLTTFSVLSSFPPCRGLRRLRCWAKSRPPHLRHRALHWRPFGLHFSSHPHMASVRRRFVERGGCSWVQRGGCGFSSSGETRRSIRPRSRCPSKEEVRR
jgi:histidinol dehydrogenase